MRIKAIHTGLLLVAMAALDIAGAIAQTDVAGSIYGAFTGSTTGNGVQQSPSNAAGGLLEVRHIKNPLVGFEATYAFNRANQVYVRSSVLPCPTPGCTAAISANAHEITGDWIASVKAGKLRPFALAGVGLLLDVPVGGQNSTSTTVKPVFVYGAGIDWGLLPHIGLRFQYRGNLYNAPNLTKLYTSTDRFTQTAEPMIGAYFRF